MIALWLYSLAWAEEHPLEGGDTLVVVTDHRAPVVYVRVHFPVGTAHPWALEHDAQSAWQIQGIDPDGELARRADDLAVDLDLGMGSTTAWLTLSCLVDDLDAALDLARDLLSNSDFDGSQLKHARKGARMEWSANLEEPGWHAGRSIAELVFDDADPRRIPYTRRLEVQTDPIALAAARDRILHHPGRVVGVSGDVTVERARSIASALLPEASGPKLGDPVYPPLTDVEGRAPITEITLRGPTQVTLCLVADATPVGDPNHPAALVAAHVLGGHGHARLSEALRHEDGSTYHVSVQGTGGRLPGPLYICTSTRVDNAEETEQRMLKTLAAFHADGITETERAEAVTSMLGREALRLQNPWTPMGDRMNALRHERPPDARAETLRRVEALDTDAVNAFIREHYDPGRFVRVHIRPK